MNSMSVGTKYAAAFTLIMAIFTGINLFGLFEVVTVAELTRNLYRHPLAVSNAVITIQREVTAMHRSMKDVALSTKLQQIEAAGGAVNRSEETVYGQFEIVKDRFLGAQSMWQEPLEQFRKWRPIREEVITLMKAGNRVEAAAITKNKGARHLSSMLVNIKKLEDFARGKADGFMAGAEGTRAEAIKRILIVLGVGIALSIGLSLWLIRSIVRPISRVIGNLRESSTQLTEASKQVAPMSGSRFATGWRSMQRSKSRRMRMTTRRPHESPSAEIRCF